MKRQILVSLAAIFCFIGLVNSGYYLFEIWQKTRTPSDLASYFAGQQVGRNLKKEGVILSQEVFARGLKDGYAGKSAASPEELVKGQQALSALAVKKIQELQKANLETGKKFLAENKKNPDWVTTGSGLQYHILKKGTGPKPTGMARVRVQYTGTLVDGKKFDSSREKGAPAEFQIDQVIPGWKEVLPLMPQGSQWVVVIPPELAYGNQGNGIIPPNAVLIFDIELLEVINTHKKANR